MIDVLASLGVDASSPERVTVELENAEDEVWRRMLPPVVVLREGGTPHVSVHVDDGAEVHVWVELEDTGERREVSQVDLWVAPRAVDGRVVGRATVEVPGDLPLGWHTLVAESGSTRRAVRARGDARGGSSCPRASTSAAAGGSWRSCTRCARSGRGAWATWPTWPTWPGARAGPARTSCWSTRCTRPSP